MPKINLAIEADSATEMKEILSQLATGSVVEEKRRSFYGLNLRHRTIENWGESRAY